MKSSQIHSQISKAIKKLPQKHTIRSVRLFGSMQSGKANNNSDIDLLVEFATPVGYFEVIRMENYLKEHLGRDVDFVTKKELSPYIRDSILEASEIVYEG